jgi:hypothetical protein
MDTGSAEAGDTGKQAKSENQEDIEMEDGPESTEAGGSVQQALPCSSISGKGEGVDCLVKVYNMEGASPIKLNEVVDFIGVLAVDPPSELDTVQAGGICQPCGENSGGNQLEAMELEQYIARNPPSSLVPRLHCVIFDRAKEPCYAQPPASLAPLINAASQANEQFANLRSEFCGVRQEILRFLAAALGGDELAAQYLLLCMCSRVVARGADGSDPIGNFALNISNVHERTDTMRHVNETLGLLLPRTQQIGLTIGELNKGTFLPTKDHQANRLVGSALQLVDGTLIAIDETVMATGKLNETGISNLQTLQRLAMFQQVHYDFQFYQRDFTLDAPVVVLSVGKSMLTVDTHVALRPQTQPAIGGVAKGVRAWDAALDAEGASASAAAATATDEFLSRARFYIGYVRDSLVSSTGSANHQGMVAGTFEVDEQMTGQIQEDFVAARIKDPRTNGDDLKRWLTMARLLCATYCQAGGLNLTPEVWKEVQDLEQKRVARLPKETKKPTTPTAQQQASMGATATA